jgi:hypothetical protein
MRPELRRKLRRYGGCIVVVIAIYWLGPPLVMRGWQIGWHVIKRNQLKLSRKVYSVPLRWLVERPGPSDALLVDAPLLVRRVTTIYISESAPMRQVALDGLLTLHQQMFVKDGDLHGRRRLHSDAEEIDCLEGTQLAMPGFYIVHCYGSSGMYSYFAGDSARVEAYYTISESARLN